jgi:type I restriction enzyme M protein
VKGRAGFVMSSQASSAGHGEKEVRQKIIETGAVDVMMSVRANFFYTRSVPCELWFFDRGKPAARKDKVLMLDARNVYRKVTRKIYDFSPEQMRNLSAIVSLYRGQRQRFLTLVKDYFSHLYEESRTIPDALSVFNAGLSEVSGRFKPLADAVRNHKELKEDKKQALAAAVSELAEADRLYRPDARVLVKNLESFVKKYAASLPAENAAQHNARKAFDPHAESIRGLIKQVDLLYKLAARVADLGAELAADETISEIHDRRTIARLLKQLDGQRKAAVEQLKQAIYFHRQIVWLQDRFPKAELEAVPGLVKLVSRKEVEAADWSLTPGRYVGVAPPEEDEDIDFEQTIRDIHTELAGLNKEALELAAKIQENFEELI